MGRIPRGQIPPPNDRGARNTLVMVGIAIILLFALVGVVSAGAFVGSKIAGGSKSTKTKTPVPSGRPTALADVRRAQAQATQIVRSAQKTGKAIIQRDTARARSQAHSIVAAAQTKATATAGSASSAAPSTSGSGSQVASGQGTGTGYAGTATGQTSTGQYGSSSATGQTAPGTSGYATAQGATGTSGSSVNLSGLPASWKVVAYNATFGSGPGSAGSISVTNRDARTFSGTAEVVYTNGTTARAGFSGLAPGQTVVLPLNGAVYPGGGYHIEVVGVH